MDASHLCLWIIDYIGCLLDHGDCYFQSRKSHGIGECNPDDQMSGLRPQDSRILGIQDFRFGFPNPDLDHHRARRTWSASKNVRKRSTKDLKEQLANLCPARRDDMKTMQELLRGVAHITHFS